MSGALAAGSNASVVGCQELPAFGPYVGVVMGVAGSIGINVGQNLQAGGIRALADTRVRTRMNSLSSSSHSRNFGQWLSSASWATLTVACWESC